MKVNSPKRNINLVLLITISILGILLPINIIWAATFTETGQAIVTVGSPPIQCPSGWPLVSGVITQGPLGSVSHAALYPGEQAIDIGSNPLGTPTFATFSGKIVVAQDFDDLHYGKHVDIEGICNGKTFIGRWAHLNSLDASITVGAQISKGQEIGKIDSTGNSTGTHLHYSFMNLEMGTPYIPQNPAFPSCQSDDGSSCAVSW